MSVQAAKDELDSIIKYQDDIHMLTEEEISRGDSIESLFYREFVKSFWFSTTCMPLAPTPHGNEIIYQVNDTFHYLMYTYRTFNLPAVRVRPEYKDTCKIAWCHNPGTNIVKQAFFKEDDDIYNTWDNVWADIYFQFFQTPGEGMRDNHYKGVGNVPYLEEWSTFLPSYPINVEEPWFYSFDPATSFPIWYKNSQVRAKHHYLYRRNVSDLLRVKVLEGGKWINKIGNFSKYVDIDPNAQFELPQLHGRYAMITSEEIDLFKCKFDKRTFYIRDVVSCDESNVSVYGKTAEIPLSCDTPCQAIFWVSENTNASKIHNYSNYTNDINDLKKGYDPIKSNTLKYGNNPVFEDYPSHHFSIAEARKHFYSAPCEVGYHGKSYAWDCMSYNGDVGIILKRLNAKLYCKIADNNILSENYDEHEDDENENEENETHKSQVIVKSPEFLTRVRLLVVRKFTIEKTDDNKYKFEIE